MLIIVKTRDIWCKNRKEKQTKYKVNVGRGYKLIRFARNKYLNIII